MTSSAAHGRSLRDMIKQLAKVAWERKEADERLFACNLRTRLVCVQYKLSAGVALRRAKAIEVALGIGVANDGGGPNQLGGDGEEVLHAASNENVS